MSDTEAIKQFLESRVSLIVDKSSTIRSSVSQVLVSLGQPKAKIIDCSRYNDAMEVIKGRNPKVIFTEYHIDAHLGFDFFQKVNTQLNSEKDRLFCMITGNTEDYVIAQAAEEDIDAYILKPFSKETVEKYLQKCIHEKLVASPYFLGIEKAKSALQNKNLEFAIKTLQEVQVEFGPSALAFYYLGLCKEALGQFIESLADFESGLKIHQGHYKCLLGKLSILEKLKRNQEAYEIAKYLAEKYPINPERLGSIMMLAVFTKNFSDVDKYFNFYTQLETRTEKVGRIVAAAMFATAKFMLNQNNQQAALAAFRRCVTASGRNKEYLAKIVDALQLIGESKAALEFLHMSSMEDQIKPEWKVQHFNTISMFESPDRIIQKGKALISEGVIHIDVAKKIALLLASRENKIHAENFVYSIVNQLPDYRNELIGIIEEVIKTKSS
jgi:CheY-like chemotaxis protein